MLLFEILRVAVDAMLANKLRSLLTMLGIVIGIAAVITMLALGEAAQRAVQAQLRTLGTNVLTVRPGQSFFGGIGQADAKLTVDDAQALLEQGRDIMAVAPELEARYQVEYGAHNANLSIVGSWPSYFEVNNYSFAGGRAFTESEDRGRRRVAVVGALIGEDLGLSSSADLLGATVRIRGVPFEIVGVLQEKGAMGFFNPDEDIYVPLATAQMRVMGTDLLRSIGVQARSEASMDAAMAQTDQILRRAHRLRPGEDADFTVRNQTTLLSTMGETTKTFSFLLAGIATISLLVGGIGIMNIMLVSVTERTREIGLRKALGARRRDILLQFLIEALVLCLAGGALGVAAGYGASNVLEHTAGWSMEIAPRAIGLAFGFSAAVGLFFGLWPARRAAGLAPIEALRYE
jgi:putative ABC transport system permease protein